MSWFDFEENGIVKQWDELMREIYGDKPFFLVYSIKKQEWGYSLMVTIPVGKTYTDLENIAEKIKAWFPCNVEMSIPKLSTLANVKLIMKDFENMDYKPIKCSPFEIFVGYDAIGNPILINMNRFPHCLIAGSTGSGKSRLLFIILTNLIYNNNADIYLTQIRKRDFRKFQSFAKEYAQTEEEAAYMFNKIVKKINRRVDYLDRNDYENIEECKGMKPIYVFGDEFSFYMEDKTDEPNLAKYKSICLARIKEIIKTGRSVGVFLVIGIQRTTATELLPIVKSQIRTIITFAQVNKASSENVIGCSDATKLQEREFIIVTNKLQCCKTPYIDKQIIESTICIPKPKTIVTEPLATFNIHSVAMVEPKIYAKFCERIISVPKEPPRVKKKGEMTHAN